jgi:hypothetical protein
MDKNALIGLGLAGAGIAIIGYAVYQNMQNGSASGGSGSSSGSSNSNAPYIIPYSIPSSSPSTSPAPIINFPSSGFSGFGGYPAPSPQPSGGSGSGSSGSSGSGSPSLQGFFTSSQGNTVGVYGGSAPSSSPTNSFLANLNANAGAGIVTNNSGQILPESGYYGANPTTSSQNFTSPSSFSAISIPKITIPSFTSSYLSSGINKVTASPSSHSLNSGTTTSGSYLGGNPSLIGKPLGSGFTSGTNLGGASYLTSGINKV